MASTFAELQIALAGGVTRLEGTPFARALGAGTVSRTGYVGWLKVLAVIHAAHERMAGRMGVVVKALSAFSDEASGAYALLAEDFDAFRLELVPDVIPAMTEAVTAAQRLTVDAAQSPARLVGHLYALEAARGLPLASDEQQASLSLDGAGARYACDCAADSEGRARALAAALEAHPLDDRDREQAKEAARWLLDTLTKVLEVLEPVRDDTLGIHSSSLNPISGAHPVTQDPRELRAALEATDRCFSDHPYFEHRYGALGRRFTDADGAWMAYLVEEDAEKRTERIDWLGRMLAGRGMPVDVVRYHLEYVADALELAIPNDAYRYRVLRDQAARLDARYRRYIPRERATELIDAFVALLDEEPLDGEPLDGEPLDGAPTKALTRDLGELLMAAVVDQTAGHDKAFASVYDWLAAPERFPPAVVTAADALVAWARKAARARDERAS